jgi:iron complex transport system ATP-binding protein
MSARLEADRLAFAHGAVPVLDEVSLAVEAGELLGVIGPNGAGKTTLVRLLCGVLAPARGEVRLAGRPLAAYPRRELARRLAVVPQDPVVDFPFTALEVVLMGRAPHLPALGFPGARDLALARAAMAELGVAALEARPIDRLSGGERQRVLLARAFAQEPEVLLLDEPTTHLDLRHATELLELVAELNREAGLTVAAALHDLTSAALYFDRVAFLRAGRVELAGPPDEVVSEATIRAVFGAEVRVGRDADGVLTVRPRARPGRRARQGRNLI